MTDAFKEGMELSRMQFSLSFLAGSPEKGGEWIKSIRNLSMVSGFSLKELHHSAQTLAGGFTKLDNVVPTLQKISMVSAGIGASSEQMNRFSLAVTQVVAKGRFMAQELNQLTDAGLPLSELAKTARMDIGTFRQAVEDGKIGSDVLLETLNRLTEVGGRFHGMFAKMGATPLGQLSRITTMWEQFKAELGMCLMESGQKAGIFDAIERGMIFLLDNKDQVRQFVDECGQWMDTSLVSHCRRCTPGARALLRKMLDEQPDYMAGCSYTRWPARCNERTTAFTRGRLRSRACTPLGRATSGGSDAEGVSPSNCSTAWRWPGWRGGKE